MYEGRTPTYLHESFTANGITILNVLRNQESKEKSKKPITKGNPSNLTKNPKNQNKISTSLN